VNSESGRLLVCVGSLVIHEAVGVDNVTHNSRTGRNAPSTRELNTLDSLGFDSVAKFRTIRTDGFGKGYRQGGRSRKSRILGNCDA
jgi:hypothetical protein